MEAFNNMAKVKEEKRVGGLPMYLLNGSPSYCSGGSFSPCLPVSSTLPELPTPYEIGLHEKWLRDNATRQVSLRW